MFRFSGMAWKIRLGNSYLTTQFPDFDHEDKVIPDGEGDVMLKNGIGPHTGPIAPRTICCCRSLTQCKQSPVRFRE